MLYRTELSRVSGAGITRSSGIIKRKTGQRGLTFFRKRDCSGRIGCGSSKKTAAGIPSGVPAAEVFTDRSIVLVLHQPDVQERRVKDEGASVGDFDEEMPGRVLPEGSRRGGVADADVVAVAAASDSLGGIAVGRGIRGALCHDQPSSEMRPPPPVPNV